MKIKYHLVIGQSIYHLMGGDAGEIIKRILNEYLKTYIENQISYCDWPIYLSPDMGEMLAGLLKEYWLNI